MSLLTNIWRRLLSDWWALLLHRSKKLPLSCPSDKFFLACWCWFKKNSHSYVFKKTKGWVIQRLLVDSGWLWLVGWLVGLWCFQTWSNVSRVGTNSRVSATNTSASVWAGRSQSSTVACRELIWCPSWPLRSRITSTVRSDYHVLFYISHLFVVF